MSQATQAITSTTIADTVLEPAPIPAGDVISGNPQASWALFWSSPDRTLYNGVWRCTPGVFMLSHPGETITCLQGSMTITPEGGEPVTVRAGELVYIEEGTRARWEVHETVLKTFHSHDSTGQLLLPA
jgi:uncharacterized cupin superfamily protein